MGSWQAFWAMGGYGAYVWPSFALSAAVLIALWASSRRGLRQAKRALAAAEGEIAGHGRGPEGAR